MHDEHAITTIEQLREVIPAATAKTQTKIVPRLGALERRFIERSPMVFIGTASPSGQATVSPKGDAPGFVVIEDDETLVIPDRPGNGLAFGLINLIQNPQVGLLFLNPGSTETFRVDGRAALTRDPALLEALGARGKDAVLAIRVRIQRCYFHCSKAFLRSDLWKPEQWPAPFALSWGRWAQQWYGVPDDAAAKVDESIAKNEREEL
jgi:PPOX class probable FMN-dependent enzyme